MLRGCQRFIRSAGSPENHPISHVDPPPPCSIDRVDLIFRCAASAGGQAKIRPPLLLLYPLPAGLSLCAVRPVQNAAAAGAAAVGLALFYRLDVLPLHACAVCSCCCKFWPALSASTVGRYNFPLSGAGRAGSTSKRRVCPANQTSACHACRSACSRCSVYPSDRVISIVFSTV